MECSDKNKKKWKAYNERGILKISGRRGLPAAPEIPCWRSRTPYHLQVQCRRGLA